MKRYRSALLCFALCACGPAPEPALGPAFIVNPNPAFSDGRALTNAVADFDNDGDLDLFVGFNGQPNRLYRNTNGSFEDVAELVGLADTGPTRSTAWGDFDLDGHLDLFLGFASRDASESRLYRNDGDGAHFTDVTQETGTALEGSFRQASWVDFDSDGDMDLFVGLRDRPNVMLRNHNGRFEDVAGEIGLDDARRTVGAAWFDYDQDGDLDLVVGNMDGDANGLFRNDGARFVDVAPQAGLDDGGRGLGDPTLGTVRPTIVDFDNDGWLDVFMANYGPNGLFRNLGNGTFENVAATVGLAIDGRYDTGTWDDFDLDGRPDLFVNGTVTGGVAYRDYLFRNGPNGFEDVTTPLILGLDADHGAQWADLDADGDVDLALTGGTETGMHHLLTNQTAGRSLSVLVTNEDGRHAHAGAEVRVFSAAGVILGTRILDTGSGYNSQNAMPVHFGIPVPGPVRVEITTMGSSGRRITNAGTFDPDSGPPGWITINIARPRY